MKRMLLLAAILALAALPGPAQGQGAKREFVIEPTRAMSVMRDVLVGQGYEVVRTEIRGNDRIVYYRRGNMGRGKGKGPLVKLIIRRTGNRVVFVDTPDRILLDVNVKLRL